MPSLLRQYTIFKGKLHPTQKPDKLYEIPILTHTAENELVFDPFAGSGTCAVAAIKNNRRFLIIERDEGYVEICKDRIQKIQNDDKCSVSTHD
jgi:site-specific DNA-methyltransferase (adenine-specific)